MSRNCRSKLRKWQIYPVFFTLVLFATSCSPLRQLSENEYLLAKNTVQTRGERFDTDELHALVRQSPNKKILFVIRFHLRAYTLGNRIKKDNRLKKTLTQTIGEAPVLVDTLLAERSARQMELFLNSRGHFNSSVSYEVSPYSFFRPNGKKKTITYNVNVSRPYTLRNFTLEIEDQTIELTINSTQHSTLILPGSNYNEDNFSDERDRLTNLIKSKGYYYFNKDNIRFIIDTNLRNHQFDLLISIPNIYYKQVGTDSLVKKDYRRYIIRQLDFRPDKPTAKNLLSDTIRMKDNPVYFFVFNYEPDAFYKSKSLERFIFIRPGKLYDMRDVSQTFRSLARLNNFRYTNIVFSEPDSIDQPGANLPGLLDCTIHYTRSNRISVTTETELRNTFGSLGLAANVGFTQRNVFKGAENLRIAANGAMEVQPTPGIETDPGGVLPFNTYEAGVNAYLDFPRFLIPISQDRFPRYFKPKTTLNTGYNYQKRPDYTRYVANVSFGYDWQESQYKRHILNPAEINSVKIFPTDEFLTRIEKLDPVIKNIYSDHLITAMKYTYLYTTQDLNKPRDFMFFRFNLELAGNTMHLINSTIKGRVDPEEGYRIFNIRYAQYIRSDADVRLYKYFTPDNQLAFRTAVGYGKPYGNSLFLPFEKSYFVGGANGIRAWNIRSLGPGSYHDIMGTGLDKIGDIALESSIEYRFPVYKYLKSALFIDAGNVWLQKENPNFPGGNFSLDRFYKEIAIGAGIGLRLDFSFFVIRTDFAAPMRNPKLPEDQRWTIRQTQLRDFRFNLGIGYPF